MMFCLAEAKRDLDREFIRSCATVSICQDKRGTRLLTRFRASDLQLNVRTGVIVLARCTGTAFDGITGAESVQVATLQGIGNLCTPGTPPYIHGPAPARDEALFEKLINAIEVFVADAASDEMLCGRNLTTPLVLPAAHDAPTGPAVDVLGKHLHNLKFIERDRSHACRRIVSRPWSTDAYMQHVVGLFVTNAHSITNLVEHSEIIKNWFQECINRAAEDQLSARS